MNCPRCRVDLERTAVGGGQAWLCKKCEGCWFDDQNLEAFLDMSDDDLAETPLAVTLEAQDHGLELDQPVACPRCQERMRRYHYAGDSQVVLDGCPMHGIWLDDGELRGILDYLTVNEGMFDDLPGDAALPRVPISFWNWLKRLFKP